MIYLIWTIITLSVLFFFFHLLIGFITKGKRIFKPQWKTVSIIILIIGVVQIFLASDSEKSTNRIILNDVYNEKNKTKVEKVILEDNLVFDINMYVTYSIEKNQNIPIESNSYLTGLISGFEWVLTSVDTNNYKPNEKVAYTAEGVLNWHLFGITLYTESKTFSGNIK